MEQKQKRQRPPAASPGEAVYGLGLVGALVWPAFLVYDALKALHR